MTNVKVCGITSAEDARLAHELGAWAIGLIFHPASPRSCEIPAAEEIGSELKRSLEVVGVFVNSTLEEVAQTAERCSLTALQLHGDEGPAYCREAARRTGCRVIKAARVTDLAAIRDLERFRVDAHLLDSHVPGRRGGTGETFAWELVRAHPRSVPVIVSGGLRPDNVADAVAATRPFAVDTASGTEAAPGRKDPRKLRGFFSAVRRAATAADGASGADRTGSERPGARPRGPTRTPA